MKDAHGYEDSAPRTFGHIRVEIMYLIVRARNGGCFHPISYNLALRTAVFDGPTPVREDCETAARMYPWMEQVGAEHLAVADVAGCIDHLRELWGEEAITDILLELEET